MFCLYQMIQIAVLNSSLAEMVLCGDSGTEADVGGLVALFHYGLCRADKHWTKQ